MLRNTSFRSARSSGSQCNNASNTITKVALNKGGIPGVALAAFARKCADASGSPSEKNSGLSTGMPPAQLMLPPARFSIVQNVRATDALAHRRAWRRIPIASSRCRQRQRRACDTRPRASFRRSLCGASSGPCTSSQLRRAAESAPCNASSWSREPRHPWIFFFGKARLSSQGLLFRPEASLHYGNFD